MLCFHNDETLEIYLGGVGSGNVAAVNVSIHHCTIGT